jgi:hypothetical protein
VAYKNVLGKGRVAAAEVVPHGLLDEDVGQRFEVVRLARILLFTRFLLKNIFSASLEMFRAAN